MLKHLLCLLLALLSPRNAVAMGSGGGNGSIVDLKALVAKLDAEVLAHPGINPADREAKHLVKVKLIEFFGSLLGVVEEVAE